MALEDFLAGIGGATKGALDAYSWQKDQNERKRQFDVRAGLDRDDLDFRREQALRAFQEHVALLNQPKPGKIVSYQTVDEHGNPVTKWGYEDDLVGQTAPLPGKPPAPEKPIAIDTVDPKTGGPATLFADPKAGDIFPKPVKPTTPLGTTPKDDPSLPNGVRAYLGKLAGKYTTRAAAKTELDSALESLFQAHPHLDVNKLYQAFDRTYPADEPIHGAGVKPAAAATATTPGASSRAAGAGPLGTTPATLGDVSNGVSASQRPRPAASARQPQAAAPFGVTTARAASATPGQPAAAGRGRGAGPTAGAAARAGTLPVGQLVTTPDGRIGKIVAVDASGNATLVDPKTGQPIEPR